MKPALKGLCAAFLASALMGLAGCSGETAVPAAAPATVPSAPSYAAETPAKTPEKTPDATQSKTPAKADGKYDESDLELEIKDFRATLGTDVNEVIASLGKGYQYSEAISCAYNGMDKTYIYPGVEFYTYPDGNKDYLLEVILVDDTYSTASGLKVGCTEEEIVKAYGKNYFTEGIVMRYNLSNDPNKTGEPSLYFVMEDGVATSLGIALGGEE
jgi:hypothetical protein